jgi:hypothetical protein
MTSSGQILAAEFIDVDDVPLAHDLAAAGSLGVCGPQPVRCDVAPGAVLQPEAR